MLHPADHLCRALPDIAAGPHAGDDGLGFVL
jgi:hypothetical protein